MEKVIPALALTNKFKVGDLVYTKDIKVGAVANYLGHFDSFIRTMVIPKNSPRLVSKPRHIGWLVVKDFNYIEDWLVLWEDSPWSWLKELGWED